ncbi:hypothetical protein EGW08_014123 [Elysia chlorotica]|uniref:Uncharacterized protein n=1 Tax=Elysia chlorotica TaxID=188477 RepID=A0A433T947_ELYCH|nr:hypothetical protein EGW08_014123 [Elysia chlorotica]
MPRTSFSSPLPNNTHSPGLGGQARQFLESPSDSRVPRTPSVPDRNVCVDQSVPLTPDNHRSSHPIFPAVFRTPNRTAPLSASTPPQTLLERHSPFHQEISPITTLQSLDQCVPSTPKDFYKSKLKWSSLSASSISPVPHFPAENVEVSTPTQNSQYVASTSFAESISPTVEHNASENLGESGYFSTSPDKGNDSYTRGKGRLVRSLTDSSRKKCSTDQYKSDPPRKRPPSSRRRLSLSLQGPKDVLRRAAHHNCAFQRSSTRDMCDAESTNSSITLQLKDSLEVDSSTEIFPLEDSDISSESRFSESVTRHSIVAETSGKCVNEHVALVSPAGDVSNVLLNHNPKLAFQNRINSPQALDTDNCPCPIIQYASRADEPGEGSGKNQPTPLDLFNDDNIFD